MRRADWVARASGVGGLAGAGLLAVAFVAGPEFVSAHFSPDGELGRVGVQRLAVLRLALAGAGVVLGGAAVAVWRWGAAARSVADRFTVVVPARLCRALVVAACLLHLWVFGVRTLHNTVVVDGQRYFAPMREDVMISMRYADNLAQGKGLVWNVGERVEGYTNFLWTVVLVVPHLLGVARNHSFLFPVLLNLVLAAIAWTWLGRVLGVVTPAALARSAGAVVFACALPLSYWGAMGFETTALAACLVVALWGVARGIDGTTARPLVGTSIALAIGVLVRDSFVLMVPAMALPLVVARGLPERARWRRLVAVAALPVAAKAAHLAFRWVYYGELLPNTYYLKATNWDRVDQLAHGALYAGGFLLLASPLLLSVLLGLGDRLSPRRLLDGRGELAPAAAVLAAAAAVAIQLAYVAWVGGDAFPAFRFFVEVIPALAILAAASVDSVPSLSDGASRLALHRAVVLAAGVVLLAWGGDGETWRQSAEVVSGRRSTQLEAMEKNVRTARAVAELAAETGQSTVAVFFAGTLPYLDNQIRFVDLLGKMDPGLARGPVHPGHRPGHNKWDVDRSLREDAPGLVVSMWRSDPDRPLTEQVQVYARHPGFQGALFRSDAFLRSYRLLRSVDRGFDVWMRSNPLERSSVSSPASCVGEP